MGNFKVVFTLIVIGESELDSRVVLSAHEFKECYGLFVRENKSMICQEKDAIQPVPLMFERLPIKVTISLDEGTIGSKMKTTMQNDKNGIEQKTLCMTIVDDRTMMVEPELSMASDWNRDKDEDRTVINGLLESGNGSCEVIRSSNSLMDSWTAFSFSTYGTGRDHLRSLD